MVTFGLLMGLFDSIGGFGSASGFSSLLQTFTYIGVGIAVFFVVGGVLLLFILRRKHNKQFNIPVIIVTPRSDGRVVEISQARGGYFKSAKVGGITSFRMKRKGIGIVDMPPPESVFLSSPNRTLMLAQKGMDDYEPILPDSLARVTTTEGIKLPILQLKAKNQDATAWSFDNEQSAKSRFTIYSFWDKYQTLITMMMFTFILFLILYIQWIGMKDVVDGLQTVAEHLRSPTQPIVTSGG